MTLIPAPGKTKCTY